MPSALKIKMFTCQNHQLSELCFQMIVSIVQFSVLDIIGAEFSCELLSASRAHYSLSLLQFGCLIQPCTKHILREGLVLEAEANQRAT